LVYTDPSGHVIQFIIAAVAANAIATTVASTVVSGIAAATAISTVTAAMIQAAVTGLVTGVIMGAVTAAAGGSFSQGFKGGFIGGALFSFVGSFTQSWGTLGQSVAHGVAGGLQSEASGGKFVDGFLGGFAGRVLAPIIGPQVSGKLGSIGRVDVGVLVARLVVGGTVAEIGGGKFANGALSAAFGYVFASAARRSGASLSNANKPTNVPALTRSELNAILADMRKDPKFVALEANAAERVGGAISYHIVDDGLGRAVSGEPPVYIGRYARGYSYTVNALDVMTYDQDTAFFASDVNSWVPGVQNPFTIERVIVHELYHHVQGFFTNETNVINATNEFFGGYPRRGHEGFLIE